MKFRDILAVVYCQAEHEHVLAFAEQLTRQWGARITTLVTGWKPDLVLTRAAEDLEEEVDRTMARLRKGPVAHAVVSELVRINEVRQAIGQRAQHFDAVIVGRPATPTSDWDHAVLEGALFHSGRPLFIVPANWQTGQVGSSVMVCWKPTREAARALSAARDILVGADSMMVVVAGPQYSAGGAAAGEREDILAHFRRKNLDVDLLYIETGNRSETEAILEQARSVHADLIVMGGYGRSAATQFFFGGVTREILALSNVPILMAH